MQLPAEPTSTPRPQEPLPAVPLGDEKPVVALFAGVGGIERGLENAGGYRTEVAWELMDEARACLVDRMGLREGHDAHADITDASFGRRLPERIGVLTAGFPCQDLSQAGRTAGIHGAKSGLIFHVLATIESRPPANRPDWLVLENVAFMRHIGGGEAMRLVLSSLTRLGYAWAYRQVDTQAFGLPQRRKRLFFVACKFEIADPRAVLLSDEASRPQAPTGPGWRSGVACGFYWTEGNRGLGWAYDAIPPLKGGSTIQIPSPPAIVHPTKGLVLPTIEDAEALQGFERGWTRAAEGRGRDRGGRMRWYLVGNAVSVPVSQWIGTRMARPQQYPAERARLAGPLSGPKWPATAWQIDERSGPMESVESDWPLDAEARADIGLTALHLADLLAEGEEPHRPLSARAAAGFLSRFERSSLLRVSDPELRDALMTELRAHIGSVPRAGSRLE